MAKTRVHELAKEFGVESKFVLEKFKEMGEFVKSACSTVELPAEMRFRKEYGDTLKACRAGSPRRGAREAAAPGPGQEGCRPRLPPSLPPPSPRRPRPPRRPPPRPRQTEAPAAETPTAPEPRPEAGRRCRSACRRDGRAARPSPRHLLPRRRRRPRRPARSASRAGAPRPGNNPFASSQGMGRRPAPPRERGPAAPASPVLPVTTRPPRPPAARDGGAPAVPACRVPTRR